MPPSKMSIKQVATSMTANKIRRNIRTARRNLTAEQQSEFSFLAAKSALDKLLRLKVAKVALYLTNDGELDTAPLIEQLWQHHIEVYLPRLHPFSPGNLLFLRYDNDTTLLKNSLGIWEPKLDIRQMLLAHQLDVIVTPLVAFDNAGNRMGMGGGYYDRTLANWQLKGTPLPIGYAHDCQLVPKLPSQHWDVPLPIIITPSTSYRFS